MIDKNDVKMPVQREGTQNFLKDENKVKQIENLLDLVNSTENKQELRLKEDYYSRFHWFGFDSILRNDKSYFSYQEEAVYDFIFSLNKSGILSDQVGMGKTIEAGMIISELASRNELRSLLIIVPNEIMANKWEYELDNKFGIRRYERSGSDEVFPQVKAIKNFDEFCHSVFESVRPEKFAKLSRHKFDHRYTNPKEGDTLASVIASFIKTDVEKVVDLINFGFDVNEMEGNPHVRFDGKHFDLVDENGKIISRKLNEKGTGKFVDVPFTREYSYDKTGKIAAYVRSRKCRNTEEIQRVVDNGRFINNYSELIAQEMRELYILIGEYITTLPDEIMKIATSMTSNYPILVIPIAYSNYVGNDVQLKEFLNRVLIPEEEMEKTQNYKHRYMSMRKAQTQTDGRGEEEDEYGLTEVYEPYRIIDFFIDVGYQTLIVDEVHDYIDVCAKLDRKSFHNKDGFDEFKSGEYNRYELFDDYYFIKTTSLYKKLKNLADKANRKIFLTATPIKSDMVDFYLLTLLASNKDSEAYRQISSALERDFPDNEKRELEINTLYGNFRECISGSASAVKYFCQNSSTFFAIEESEDKDKLEKIRANKMKYPYFNNKYLRSNANNTDAIKQYLLGQLSYMSMEEIILELILAYNAENAGQKNVGIRSVMDKLNNLLSNDYGSALQTRVVFRCLLNNTIKIRFEEDFTKEDGSPIKRINELLQMEEGARLWHKMYRKYGIRHTRHQTYNLSDCAYLDILNDTKKERYKRLPVWPRRDGKVIFLLRDDVFFDSFVDITRTRENDAQVKVQMNDLPNFDKLKGSESDKKLRFKNAVAIFDYINNAMSGGDSVNHKPQNSRYESVDIRDEEMVEYKLALVNRLMMGNDSGLGSINKKVLLFAENGREAIQNWFKYQKCEPMYNPRRDVLDSKMEAYYAEKWRSYKVNPVNDGWRVSESTDDLQSSDGNVLIIIDPSRYEKGVDLQKADTIINFDINYCPLKMEQRIGRIDRIRPSGQNPQINIISFVPMNDMSGFVINFFANEMKMFTQWMGETTGIVSVPDENEKGGKGVAFEDKVYEMEKLYLFIYELCKDNMNEEKMKKYAQDFYSFLIEGKDAKTLEKSNISPDRIKNDFLFISKMRPFFNEAFLNSMSPSREGYSVVNKPNKKNMRFNCCLGVLERNCSAESCNNCPNHTTCNGDKDRRRNVYSKFEQAVKRFYDEGIKYYNELEKNAGSERITSLSADGRSYFSYVHGKKQELEDAKKSLKLTSGRPDTSFVMPMSEFNAIFEPMKKIYWDNLIQKEYIQPILDKFHKQCDAVLDSAKLFEKFIKVLSIADFMNNMEGK